MEKELNDKLIAIQSNLKAPKSQFNNFGGYAYRSVDDILEAVKPLLKDNGCTLVISDEITTVGGRVYVAATAVLSDGKDSISVKAFAREEEVKKGMDGAQITGAASSYARKYALNGLFCIDDTKDPDATNKHGKDEPEPTPKPSAKPTPKSDIDQARKALELCKDNASIDAVVKVFKNLWKDEEFKKLVEEARGRVK
jgi:hypothetical protein